MSGDAPRLRTPFTEPETVLTVEFVGAGPAPLEHAFNMQATVPRTTAASVERLSTRNEQRIRPPFGWLAMSGHPLIVIVETVTFCRERLRPRSRPTGQPMPSPRLHAGRGMGGCRGELQSVFRIRVTK